MNADPMITLIEADCIISLPDEAVEQGSQNSGLWGLSRIGARDSEGNPILSNNGTGTYVFVTDTGISTTHNEFNGRAIPYHDVIRDNDVKCTQTDTTCANDVHSHGTHCAGTVGGGVVGVAPGAYLMASKVLNDNGSGTFSGIITAMSTITADTAYRPAVMSMSLGGYGSSSSMAAAVAAAEAAGVAVVAAAGNSNADACNYNPAQYATLCVGATAVDDTMASFSNYGTCTDILAPGVWTYSSIPNNQYGLKSGTSMAAPHVSGVLAVILSAYGTLPMTQIVSLIQDYAEVDAIDLTTNPGGTTSGTPNLFLNADNIPLDSTPTSTPVSAPTSLPTPGGDLEVCKTNNKGKESCVSLTKAAYAEGEGIKVAWSGASDKSKKWKVVIKKEGKNKVQLFLRTCNEAECTGDDQPQAEGELTFDEEDPEEGGKKEFPLEAGSYEAHLVKGKKSRSGGLSFAIMESDDEDL